MRFIVGAVVFGVVLILGQWWLGADPSLKEVIVVMSACILADTVEERLR